MKRKTTTKTTTTTTTTTTRAMTTTTTMKRQSGKEHAKKLNEGEVGGMHKSEDDGTQNGEEGASTWVWKGALTKARRGYAHG